MAEDRSGPLSDTARLLFGAGFVFGVAFTMLVLAVVTVAVSSRRGWDLVGTGLVVTIGAGILFAAIVGLSLYFLAFPENRVEVPVGRLGGTADGVGEGPDEGLEEGLAPEHEEDFPGTDQ